MASETQKPHFVLFPLMAQGHMIPMLDIAKLLAQRGAKVTYITTPYNATRLASTFARFTNSGFDIQVVQLQFPCEKAGLPKGCENVDLLPSLGLVVDFFNALVLMKDEFAQLLEQMPDPPSCIISDTTLPWTIQTSQELQIPRIVFHGVNCFYLLCLPSIEVYKVHERIESETELFSLPGLPDRVKFTKSQLPLFKTLGYEEFAKQMHESNTASYGVIINSFEEMEAEFVEAYKKVRDSDKVWCIGPVCLGNRDILEKAQRGNKNSAIDEDTCLKWLDGQNPCSVIYVCLGSLCNLTPNQLIELGLGLEASKRPFVWVIRGGKRSEELQKWVLEVGFEERNKGRCLVIFGWAPQLMILSHVAVGSFMTHCGWNSILEGISCGVSLITWPLFGDQSVNEKVVVEILRIGVRVGTKKGMQWGEEEEIGVVVKKELVTEAIDAVMGGGEGSEERRGRVRDLAEKAKRAVEGGSSYINITLLIEDVMKQASKGRRRD